MKRKTNKLRYNKFRTNQTGQRFEEDDSEAPTQTNKQKNLLRKRVERFMSGVRRKND